MVGLLGGLLLVGQPPTQATTIDHDTNDHRAGARVAAARTTSVNPATGPDFELPFVCGQVWNGSSRSTHSPSYYTIDFNRTPDRGQPALAAAPGVVTKVVTLTSSYGRYVVIDHGGGYSTLYAHLDGFTTSVGARVDQGDQIGIVGASGGVSGPHLHFEERKDGAYFPPYFHRTTFKINSNATSQNCNDRPVTGDWDGDGKTDVGVVRAGASSTTWWQRGGTPTAGTDLATVTWGIPGDLFMDGDYDGDGLAQPSVKRRQSATWYLRSKTGAMATVSSAVGTVTDVPLTGDWDGNGRDNLGYYRPSTATFYLRGDDYTLTALRYGNPGDYAVTGDWNGDGITDIGTWKDGSFWLRVPGPTGFTIQRVSYGLPGDLPVTGDWNGDGTTDLGIWRPSTAQFWERIPGAEWTRFTYGLPRG